MEQGQPTMETPSHVQPAAPRRRLDLVDMARGLALAAMVVFHGAWDLSNADLIAADVSGDPRWQWFARCIAASFLMITGVSLVLAHGSGFNARRFWRRWLLLAGAAALVTLGTWFMFPDGYVFFGILHHIALASLITLPCVGWPPALTLLAGLLAIALPHLVRSTLFDSALLVWTGLAERVPDSVDFVPLFPWIGFVLAGVALGRVIRHRLVANGWQARNAVARLTALAGRHSLAFYLVHQPVILGLIWLWQALPLAATRDAMQRFEGECRKVCTTQGAEPGFCAMACACTATAAAKVDGMEQAVRSGRLDAGQTMRLTEISETCSRAASPPP